jgi:hypothetical protein
MKLFRLLSRVAKRWVPNRWQKELARPDGVIDADGIQDAAPDDDLQPARSGGGVEGLPGFTEGVQQEHIAQHEQIIAIFQQAQFRHAREIGHQFIPDWHAPGGKQPSHMAPKKAGTRRVSIAIPVGMPVVTPVIADPPFSA